MCPDSKSTVTHASPFIAAEPQQSLLDRVQAAWMRQVAEEKAEAAKVLASKTAAQLAKAKALALKIENSKQRVGPELTCKRSSCLKTFVPANQQQRFCSNACRQAAYRLSDAHKSACKARKCDFRARRETYYALKHRDRTQSFDGRRSGQVVTCLPQLSSLRRAWRGKTHIPVDECIKSFSRIA